MCNGWNHPANCSCGFGGDTGGGGRGGSGSFRFDGWRYESYVNPNAYCPVCGVPVFFYQSPYGGRVFFDELGPPWPKHPCTDNTSSTSYPRSTGQLPIRVSPPKWRDAGWEPFLCQRIELVGGFVKITGDLTRTYEELTLYVEKEAFRGLLNALGEKVIDKGLPIFTITPPEHYFRMYEDRLRSYPLLIRKIEGNNRKYELASPFLGQYIIGYDNPTNLR